MKLRASTTPQGYAVRIALMLPVLWGALEASSRFGDATGWGVAIAGAVAVAVVGALVDRSVRRRTGL